MPCACLCTHVWHVRRYVCLYTCPWHPQCWVRGLDRRVVAATGVCPPWCRMAVFAANGHHQGGPKWCYIASHAPPPPQGPHGGRGGSRKNRICANSCRHEASLGRIIDTPILSTPPRRSQRRHLMEENTHSLAASSRDDPNPDAPRVTGGNDNGAPIQKCFYSCIKQLRFGRVPPDLVPLPRAASGAFEAQTLDFGKAMCGCKSWPE